MKGLMFLLDWRLGCLTGWRLILILLCSVLLLTAGDKYCESQAVRRIQRKPRFLFLKIAGALSVLLGLVGIAIRIDGYTKITVSQAHVIIHGSRQVLSSNTIPTLGNLAASYAVQLIGYGAGLLVVTWALERYYIKCRLTAKAVSASSTFVGVVSVVVPALIVTFLADVVIAHITGMPNASDYIQSKGFVLSVTSADYRYFQALSIRVLTYFALAYALFEWNVMARTYTGGNRIGFTVATFVAYMFFAYMLVRFLFVPISLFVPLALTIAGVCCVAVIFSGVGDRDYSESAQGGMLWSEYTRARLLGEEDEYFNSLSPYLQNELRTYVRVNSMNNGSGVSLSDFNEISKK
ncbi:MAG: hypothetical protein IJ769_01580 [Clostridia bacterium]|nr:hypothetical protein [Clostridia bacterium]